MLHTLLYGYAVAMAGASGEVSSTLDIRGSFGCSDSKDNSAASPSVQQLSEVVCGSATGTSTSGAGGPGTYAHYKFNDTTPDNHPTASARASMVEVLHTWKTMYVRHDFLGIPRMLGMLLIVPPKLHTSFSHFSHLLSLHFLYPRPKPNQPKGNAVFVRDSMHTYTVSCARPLSSECSM